MYYKYDNMIYVGFYNDICNRVQYNILLYMYTVYYYIDFLQPLLSLMLEPFYFLTTLTTKLTTFLQLLGYNTQKSNLICSLN